MREAAPTLPRLDAAVLRKLSRVDARLGMGHVLLEWSLIAAAVAVSEAFWNPLLYTLAVIWIGARQHALLILAHDGAHRLIARNPRWSDWTSEFLLAWPVLVAFRSYRSVHRRHHLYLNSEKDPDWARNRPDRLIGAGWGRFGLVMLGLSSSQKALSGWLGLGERRAETERASNWPMVRLLYYCSVVGACIGLGATRLLGLYWIVPLGTWYVFSLRLKGIAEHFAVSNLESCNASRTIRATFLETLLLAPNSSSYHLEHHLYPSVPHYRLSELHAELIKLPMFKQRAHLTGSYFAVLVEALRFAGLPRPSISASRVE